MPDIFISYAHGDGNFVNKHLTVNLKNIGFSTWIDSEKLRAGKDWRQEIDNAIRTSFALIVVMSPKAKKSEYVTYEWSYALGVGIEVIPLLLEKVKLHSRLEALQYLDFTDHFDLPWDKLTNNLKFSQANYKAPSSLAVADLPIKIKGAIDLLNDNTYFYTTDFNQIDNMKNAIGTLATSTHPHARQALIDVIEHPHKEARLAAIHDLGNIRDEQAIDKIILRLRDIDSEVRGTAAKALGRFGDAKATPELIKALKDDHVFVRSKAAEALGKIGDERSISALSRLLIAADEEPEVQASALNSLKKFNTTKADAVIKDWQRKQQILPKDNVSIQALLESIKGFTISLGDDVQFKQLKHYIVYKRRKNFISIVEHRSRIDLLLNLSPADVKLESGFTRDMRQTGHWGTGDLLVTIKNENDLERAKPLINRSYEMN